MNKVFIKNNYLIVQDIVNNIEYRHKRPESEIRKLSPTGTHFYFYYRGNAFFNSTFANITKEDGSLYTAQEWEDFTTTKTGGCCSSAGFNTASGGSEAYEEIHDFFIEISKDERPAIIINIGDSNESSSFVGNLEDYHRKFWKQLGLNLFFSTQAGIDADEWRTGQSSNPSARLITAQSNIIGKDGSRTLSVYGLGVNTYSKYITDGIVTPAKIAQIKAAEILAINTYIDGYPEMKTILHSPTWSGSPRTEVLDQIFEEISDELNLPLVKGSISTLSTWHTNVANDHLNAFHAGRTHVNHWGGIRDFCYFVSVVLPLELQWTVFFPETENIESETPLVNLAVLEPSIYSSSGQAYGGFTDRRRLAEVAVEPNTIWLLKHQGNYREIIWKNQDNSHTRQVLPVLPDGEDEWHLIVPETAATLKPNITTNINTYPQTDVFLGNIVPLLEYRMPIHKIIEGLSINIKPE